MEEGSEISGEGNIMKVKNVKRSEKKSESER